MILKVKFVKTDLEAIFVDLEAYFIFLEIDENSLEIGVRFDFENQACQNYVRTAETIRVAQQRLVGPILALRVGYSQAPGLANEILLVCGEDPPPLRVCPVRGRG